MHYHANSINPLIRIEIPLPNHLSKVPFLNTITMAIKFQHESARAQNSKHSSKPRREVSGEPNYADTLILDFYPPEL